jgi:hypothetical protein
LNKKKHNKLLRDNPDVTLASDDENQLDTHNSSVDSEISFAQADRETGQAVIVGDSLDDTLAQDDGKQEQAHKSKKKRRFKRRYLLPKPKKPRKRKHLNTSAFESAVCWRNYRESG